MRESHHHIFQGQSVTLLSASPELERLRDQALTADILKQLRETAGETPGIRNLLTSSGESMAVTAAGAVAGMLARRELPDPARLAAALDRRLEQRRTAIEAAAPSTGELIAEARGEVDSRRRNPYAFCAAWAALHAGWTAARDAANQETSAREQEAAALAAEADRERAEATARIERVRRASVPEAEPRGWAAAKACVAVGGAWWAMPLGAYLILLAIGSRMAISLAAFALAFVAVVLWCMAKLKSAQTRAQAPTALVDMARDCMRPILEKLVRVYEAREAAMIAAVRAANATAVVAGMASEVAEAAGARQRLDSVESLLRTALKSAPGGPIEEVYPGHARIAGSSVAMRLAAEGIGNTALFLESLEATGKPILSAELTVSAIQVQLAAAAGQIAGRLRFAQAFRAVAEDNDLSRLLAGHVLHLAGQAAQAVELRAGERLDRSVSADALTVAVPLDAMDAVTAFLAMNLPAATATDGFAEDQVQFVYQVHNVAREQLLVTESSAKAYGDASALERQLWHFPRRYRAPAVVEMPHATAVGGQ